MNSFKDCCDNSCCAQGGNDSCGGFGGSGFRPRRSFSFYRDQSQDFPSSGFKNFGSSFIPSGHVRGLVSLNMNGEIVGKLSGRMDSMPAVLSCLSGLANFSNCGATLPFFVQFGDRNNGCSQRD